MSKPEKTSLREAAVRTLAMPADTNSAGDIFGGWLMSQMDIAGEITARQRAQRRVVTIAVDGMVFHEPVYVGDVVSCFTEITKIGTSSISILITATAMRGQSGEHVTVTEGTFVYVALDENGRPCPVPNSG
ncbi:MAG: acyl-CoA thioesterase [Hyphomicrobiaceae bacterium]|nr:acyl-CoA thioesterase [Hyphomicrobiaceae bacterium]